MTKGSRGADAPTGAPIRLWRNQRMLFAFAGLGLALVIAAVLLLSSGGDGEDSVDHPLGLRPFRPRRTLPADLEWRPIRDAPFRRQYAASTVVDGKVWVFGGIGVKSSSTTTKVYDPAKNTWTTGPGLPLALHHLMAVTYEGRARGDRRLCSGR